MDNFVFLIINILILLANIGVLTLVLKLYTEYFKDRSISKRRQEKWINHK